MMRLNMIRHGGTVLTIAGAILCAVALLPNLAYATPFNPSLVKTHPGDVTTHYTQVTYSLDANPLTGTFTAIGEPDGFDIGDIFVYNSSFNLTMTVMRATGALVGGTVTINGDILDGPVYTGLLLQGNISGYGFEDPPINPGIGEGSLFEFTVDVTGGELWAPYYTNNTAGIILDVINSGGAPPFTGVFTSAFQNNGTGVSDTFPGPPVPEPSSVTLLGFGLALLIWRACRKSRRAC